MSNTQILASFAANLKFEQIPKDVVARLNQAFVAALNAPETKTRFAALLAEPVATSPEAFGAFMAAERAKYEPVVKASGATVD